MGTSMGCFGLSFVFHSPTRIDFGVDKSKKIGDEMKKMKATRALVVADPGLQKAGIVHEIVNLMKEKGIKTYVFTDVVPNPRDTDCIKGAKLAKEKKVQVLVGLGGGSPMDTAKCIGVLMTHRGTPVDWDANKRQLQKDIPPLICIPTTSGTGSEVTYWAVITDTKRKFKMSLGGSSKLSPTLALIDPKLTVKMPPALTGATGMDALVHAIEGYTARVANPISDALSVSAIDLISRSLLKAYRNGQDIDARTDMILASTMAGLSFSNSDVAGVHAMAEALGGVYDTPHGVANAIFLPPIFETNIPSNPAKHAKIAELLGVERGSKNDLEVAKEGAAKIRQLAKELGTPTFRSLNVDKKDLPTLAKYADENVCSRSNPVSLTYDDYLRLFEKTQAE
jgi:alcohol dehydrogenase